MKSMRIATAVAAAIVVAACATAAVAVGSTAKTVTISVASLIPGCTPAAIQQFNAQVAQFERANPSIKVKPVEYQWTAPTFAAKLRRGRCRRSSRCRSPTPARSATTASSPT